MGEWIWLFPAYSTWQTCTWSAETDITHGTRYTTQVQHWTCSAPSSVKWTLWSCICMAWRWKVAQYTLSFCGLSKGHILSFTVLEHVISERISRNSNQITLAGGTCKQTRTREKCCLWDFMFCQTSQVQAKEGSIILAILQPSLVIILESKTQKPSH